MHASPFDPENRYSAGGDGDNCRCKRLTIPLFVIIELTLKHLTLNQSAVAASAAALCNQFCAITDMSSESSNRCDSIDFHISHRIVRMSADDVLFVERRRVHGAQRFQSCLQYGRTATLASYPSVSAIEYISITSRRHTSGTQNNHHLTCTHTSTDRRSTAKTAHTAWPISPPAVATAPNSA